MTLFYLASGALSGFLAGLLGLGGGVIVAPLLVLGFQGEGLPTDVALRAALGTSLSAILFTALASVRSHHQHGAVLWSVIRSLSPGLILGALGGAWLSSRLPAPQLKLALAVFLFLVSAQILIGFKPAPSRQLPEALGLGLAGLVIGTVASLVGVGGGTMTIPFLLWHNVPLRQAVGTSAGTVFPLALAGAAGYLLTGWGQPGIPSWSLGYVYLPALGPLVLASLITAPFGARLAHRLPVKYLKNILAGVLILLALHMALK